MKNKYPPAFQVIVDGHEYAVFADGRIYGFGDDVDKITVINRIPMIVAAEVAASKEAKICQP